MIPGTFFEIGVMGPQANRSSASGYLSLDGKIPLSTRGLLYVPTAIIGYTRMFETGHALDYGLAFDSPAIKGNQSYGENYIRIELRDYYTFANPNQHNVMLRVGWMTGLPD